MASSDGLAALKIDRARYQTGWRLWPWLLAGALVLVLALGLPLLVSALKRPEVSVATVTKISGIESRLVELSAAGYIVADRQSVLASKITGRLDKLYVQEAQSVKRGELVAEIAHQDLDALISHAQSEHAEAQKEIERLHTLVKQAQAQLQAAQAPVNTLQAQIKELELKLADSRRKLERDRKVAREDALALSVVEDRQYEVVATQAQIQTAGQKLVELQRAIIVAEAQVAVAHGATNAAEARAHTAGARIKVLEAQLKDAYVYSPFDGIVTEKAAEIGEIVAPISIGGSMARGSIITVADWHSLQAEVDVAEAYIGRVKAGARAAITVDAFPDKAFAGKVQRILPRANRSKATVQVRVQFAEDPQGVVPDMGVRVKFLSAEAPPGAESAGARDRLAVPSSAVQGTSEAAFVWVFEKETATVRKAKVTIGPERDGQVEIKSGLSAGQQVVSSGAGELKEGQAVTIAGQ